MREFFIGSLEQVLNVIIVLAAIAVVVMAFMVATGGGMGFGHGMMGGGPLAGLAVLIGGGLYLIVIGGFMYLGLGIYQNTKRAADAIERLASKG